MDQGGPGEFRGRGQRFGSNLTVELRLDVSCERGVKDDIKQPKAWSCHLLRWGTWQEKQIFCGRSEIKFQTW